MSGWNTSNSDHLIRSEVWSRELKELLEDDLQATNYVRWLDGFPDGNVFTIPSIGQANVRDYVEDTAVVYDAMDTGEFQFQIAEYLSSATYITDKNKQDMFYMNELVSKFVPSQRRAISEHVESTLFSRADTGQTVSDPNTYNGVAHRMVAGGASAIIQVQDFAKALYSLKKAKVPQSNLIAIVDPSVEYTLNTLSNLVSVSNNPRWEGIVADGIATGMRFVKNVYGFDVYTSNYLPAAGQDGSGDETVSTVTVANGVVNYFFSADQDILPLVGAWRQMPRVESERNKDFQRDEYVTTCRYDAKLYRPENMVTVLSNSVAF